MAGTNKMSPGRVLGNIAGWLGGWALAQYSGSNLWVPAGTMLVAFLVFAKTPLRPPHFVPAIAVIVGHLTWFIFGAAFTGMWAPVILDVVLIGAGVAWLWARPGLAPWLAVMGLEIATLVVNVVAILSVAVGSPEHRALVVHVLFRVLALVALAFGYRKLRKSRLPADPQVAPLDPAPAPASVAVVLTDVDPTIQAAWKPPRDS
jgi:hypothetical protein